jgi:hypothetical protein
MTSEKHRCCPPIYSKLCRLDCDAAKSIRLKKLSQEALAEPAARDAAQHQMDKGLGIEERAEIAAQRGKKVVGIRGTV